MAEALVPYIHYGSERDEVTVAVVARVVPIWIQSPADAGDDGAPAETRGSAEEHGDDT